MWCGCRLFEAGRRVVAVSQTRRQIGAGNPVRKKMEELFLYPSDSYKLKIVGEMAAIEDCLIQKSHTGTAARSSSGEVGGRLRFGSSVTPSAHFQQV